MRPNARPIWQEDLKDVDEDSRRHDVEQAVTARSAPQGPRLHDAPTTITPRTIRIQNLEINEVTVLPTGVCEAVGRADTRDGIRGAKAYRFSHEIFEELLRGFGYPSYDPFVRKVVNGFKPGVRRLSRTLRAPAVDVVPVKGSDGAEVLLIQKLVSVGN